MRIRPVQKRGNIGNFGRWTRTSVLLGFLICASVSMAQLDTGTISGTVSDQSGGAIPSAMVTIRNVATGVSRTVGSNELGRYNAPALPAGNYEISAVVAGFQTLVRSGIELTVGRNAVVDLALQVGEVTQSITITGEASRVDTTTATVSNLVDAKRVLDIPLNNRDLTNLAYLQPGVLRVPVLESYALGNAVAGGLGAKLSIGGARGTENTWLLDGVSNADHSGNPQTSTGALSGAETIQEFQVITNNYSAEYPSKPGGVVSAVTKSGTNSFHGSLYEFLRNDNLDAARWEDNALSKQKPEFKRNNFGGSVGGPIIRDRTFFFGSYEGLREGRSRSDIITVPTADGRQGDLGPNGPTNPANGTKIWPVNPVVRPYLNLWPLPGGQYPLVRDLGDGRATLGASERASTTDDFGTVKLDHHFTSTRKGFLAFTWTGSDGDRKVFPLLPASPINFYPTRKHVISVRHTSIISPTMLNEFTFGHNRTEATEGYDARGYDYTNVNGVNLNYIPGHKVIGFLDAGELSQVGNDYGDFGGEVFRQRILMFKDSLSLTLPSHSIKVGAEINRTRYPYHKNPRVNGPFSFDSFQNFLGADPSDFRIGNPPGVTLLGFPSENIQDFDLRTITAGFYFQDNWKVRPSLTLNLGLRYEFQTVPTEADGNWFHMVALTSSQVVRDSPFTNPTFRNFGPRFGVAWAPGTQTSIRAGFGIYYSLYTLLNMAHSTGEMAPINTNVRIRDAEAMAAGAAGIRFPDVFTTQFDLFQRAAAPDMRWIETNQKTSYIYRWSLTIDREMGPWFLSGGYSGSVGRHLWVNNETGISRWIGYPENVPTDQKQFPASGAVRINPAFNNISIQSPRGNSYYHGLTANVSRRLSRGLQLQGAYTLSKNIDQGSGTANVTDNFPQGQRIIYNFDMQHRTGRAPFDIRNNFVSNVTFDFPRTALTGVEGALLNGWQVNGILTLSDGHAFFVTDAVNTAQRRAFIAIGGLRPNLVAGGNNNPVLGTPSAGQDRYYDAAQFVPSVCRAGEYCYNTRDNPKFDARFAENAARPDLGYQVGYFGNLGSYTLTGPGLVTFDFSLNKDIQLTEGKRLQFRSEFFNLFNRANFALPDTGVFLSTGSRNPLAGQITSTRTSARQIQFGLKFIF